MGHELTVKKKERQMLKEKSDKDTPPKKNIANSLL